MVTCTGTAEREVFTAVKTYVPLMGKSAVCTSLPHGSGAEVVALSLYKRTESAQLKTRMLPGASVPLHESAAGVPEITVVEEREKSLIGCTALLAVKDAMVESASYTTFI